MFSLMTFFRNLLILFFFVTIDSIWLGILIKIICCNLYNHGFYGCGCHSPNIQGMGPNKLNYLSNIEKLEICKKILPQKRSLIIMST